MKTKKRKPLETAPTLPEFFSGATWSQMLEAVRDRRPVLFVLSDRHGRVVDAAVYQHEAEKTNHTKAQVVVVGESQADPVGESLPAAPTLGDIENVSAPNPVLGLDPEPEEPVAELPPAEENQAEPPAEESETLPPASEGGQELKVFDRVEFSNGGNTMKGIVTRIDEAQGAVWVKLPTGKIIRIKVEDLLSILVS